MMDIYARVVLQGGPSSITELERAMEFCEQAEGLMRKRGWLALPPANSAASQASPVSGPSQVAEKPFPGMRDWVLNQSPAEHPLPVSDASGTA